MSDGPTGRDREPSEAEYRRFVAIQHRTLSTPLPEVSNERILVTGGTGRIGSTLVRLLAQGAAGRVVSLSRGLTMATDACADAEYWHADVRDEAAMCDVIHALRPSIVMHLAAIRDPGEAEGDPVEAITTNVLGTHTVTQAAVRSGVRCLVYASTGKASRLYTRDIYASTKKVGEAVAAMAAKRGLAVSIARFTHVVDNSLIHAKLKAWLRDDLVHLHDPHIAFYAQSARESAQLLWSGISTSAGQVRLSAIRDVGMYFDLVEVARGMRVVAGSPADIRFTGFPRGYASVAHPAQYDPATADEVGPMLNAVDIDGAPVSGSGAIVTVGGPPSDPIKLCADLARIQRLRAADDPVQLTDALEWTSRHLLAEQLRHVSTQTIDGLLLRCEDPPRNEEHAVINDLLFAEARRRCTSGPG